MRKIYAFVVLWLGLFTVPAIAQSVVLTAQRTNRPQPHLRSLRDGNNPFGLQQNRRRPSSAQITVRFSENFDSGIPSTWVVADSAGNGVVWQGVTDYSSHTLNGTPFAFVNSDAGGSVDVDTYLTSPVITVNAAPGEPVLLSFEQYFNVYSGNEVADVDVWDGSQWVNVLRQQGSDIGYWNSPDMPVIDVTSYINAQFKVRFHYYNANYDWYWAVDNVTVFSPNHNDLAVYWGVPLSMPIGDDAMFSLIVSNVGSNVQNDFTTYVAVTDTLDNTLYHSDTIPVTGASLAYNDFHKVDFPNTWTVTLPEGKYHVHFGVIVTGDEDTSNNELVWDFYAHQFAYTGNRVYTADVYDENSSGDQDHFGWFDFASGQYHDLGAYQNFYGDYYMTGTFVNNNLLVTVDNYNDIYLTDSTGNNYVYGWIPVELIPQVLTGLSFVENSPGILYATTADHLYGLNPYLDVTPIGDYPGKVMIGLDIDPSGTLYALDIVSDSLYTVNTSDASLSGVGHIGFNMDYVQDIGVDDVSGNLYGTLFEVDTTTSPPTYHSGLYSIDKTTGQATLIGTNNYSDEYAVCAPLGNVTASNTLLAESQWMLYPNPAATYVKIVAPMKVQRVQIMSFTGQILRTWQAGSERFKLHIDGLSPGLYLIRIEGDNRVGTRRLMIK